ncbi:MAG: Bcr/CflA family drug resistance efflux transporter, partial [Rhodobacteraceae bacterium GWE1_64_9]
MTLPSPKFLDPNTPPTLLTITLLAGISALTMNIFLPSLPGMAEWFDAPYALLQLSVALYLALSAVLQILIGPVSDRYGRRPVMIWSMVIFLIATVGTLLAPNATVFLLCRMAQAVVAAGMVLSRAIIRDMVSGDRAASMMGYVMMGMSLVPMIGPVIGGVLDEMFGWQANFGLLLGLGLVVFALVLRDQGETAKPSALTLGGQIAQYPALLRSQRFWGYCLAASFSSGCFFAYLGGAPYVGSFVFGLGSSQIGMLFALTAVGYGLGNFLAGRYSVRVGMNRMVLWGCIATTSGMLALLALSFSGMMTAAGFFGLTLVMGLGNGITLPNANAGILSVRPELAGSAAGLGGAIMIGGGAALAALATAILPEGAT